MVLSILCLFIASSHTYGLWQNRYRRFEYHQRPLELWAPFWLSALLLIIAGVLMGISPEVFFHPRDIGFKPVEFIVSATIPIFVLIFFGLVFSNIHWSRFVMSLPRYIRNIFYGFGPMASSIWIGVAIGKAIHIRQ
jgi:hypothetical protein